MNRNLTAPQPPPPATCDQQAAVFDTWRYAYPALAHDQEQDALVLHKARRYTIVELHANK